MTAAESAPGTLVARMGIEIVEEDPRRLVARMPLTGNRQMYGFLHGGASAAFAQALATHAAALEAGPGGRVTGQELSCTHHRAARGEAGWKGCAPRCTSATRSAPTTWPSTTGAATGSPRPGSPAGCGGPPPVRSPRAHRGVRTFQGARTFRGVRMSTTEPVEDRVAVLAGVGGWVPPHVVTNDDLSAHLDTSDEWIRTRTGIRTRHRVSPGMATSDLAVEAGRRALDSSGDDRAGAVVLATTTPDRICPATAPDVAARLGLAGVPAFDVSAVCTGFLYGLATAAGLIATGVAERVLLIGADAFTTIVDPTDRSTAVIFADGAGAVVLRAGRRRSPARSARWCWAPTGPSVI